MKVQANNNGLRNTCSRATSSPSRATWVSLILSLATQSSAFHFSSREPFAMVKPVGSLLEDGTDCHASGKRNVRRSPFSLNARRASSLQETTRLQFSDGDDDAATCESSPQGKTWWNNIFPAQPEPIAKEQDNVDEYLEFLDRRYRRLHSQEKGEEPKHFSAVNWLLQGSPKREEVVATQQQQENALYVLGVAGLASQKLLQKHQLPAEDKATTPESKLQNLVTADIVNLDTENVSPSVVLIKKVMVPIVRVLYIVQRHKEVFLSAQTARVKSLLSTSFRSIAKSLIYGPAATTKAVLEIGGGKQTIALTFTAVYTVLLLLRPMLKAAVTEGSVHP